LLCDCFVCCSTLKMEAINSSETSETFCRILSVPAARPPRLPADCSALSVLCSTTDGQAGGGGKREENVEVAVNLRPTVSRPVCPGVRRPSGTCDQFFFRHKISSRQLRLCYFVAPSLTRGRVCNLLYNSFWALPEQSLLGRSPAEFTALFYCLI
jgi:hypothetical protein